jgi:hypothetical protein
VDLFPSRKCQTQSRVRYATAIVADLWDQFPLGAVSLGENTVQCGTAAHSLGLATLGMGLPGGN